MSLFRTYTVCRPKNLLKILISTERALYYNENQHDVNEEVRVDLGGWSHIDSKSEGREKQHQREEEETIHESKVGGKNLKRIQIAVSTWRMYLINTGPPPNST